MPTIYMISVLFKWSLTAHYAINGVIFAVLCAHKHFFFIGRNCMSSINARMIAAHIV